jgi:hypothetical protein
MANMGTTAWLIGSDINPNRDFLAETRDSNTQMPSSTEA